MDSKIPEWMKELYIAVLKFGVPTDRLMFYRRDDGWDRPWTVGTIRNPQNSNIQQFLDLLQEKDEKDIDY